MHQSLLKKIGAHSSRCILLSGLLLLVAGSSTAFALPVRFGLGPDNNQDLLLSHIHSARENLTINIYLFDHPAIAEALIHQINSGVTVKLLIEGQPFGSISANGRTVISSIASAMARSGNRDNQIRVMTKSASGAKRRFRYDHAKYVVADHIRSLISSENFTESGHANKGAIGNRGWDTVIDDSEVASNLEEIFELDSDKSFGDVRQVALPAESVALPKEAKMKPRPVPAISIGSGNASQATLITSPDSLDELVRLLQSAKKAISIEHMSLPMKWRSKPNAGQNPIITELIRAAQRGVEVRVLLNDERVFSNFLGDDDDQEVGKKPNQLTVDFINSVADSERLPLAARIIDIRKTGITYLHNKGIIVDGTKALISSINGSQNSVMNNRELAVLLESRDAAQYYVNAFNFDWSSSDLQKAAKNLLSFGFSHE